MICIHKTPDVVDKLTILSQDSKYDLACACCTRKDEHRVRSADHKWIYPVIMPNGRKTFLFKTLVSNACVNNCKYCPLRVGADPRRCTLTAEETVRTFLEYRQAGMVDGIFLSSGVTGSPDATMDRINTIARVLRQKHEFKGYIHLKVIPGASDGAINEAVSLATAVSCNIETAGEKHFRQLCTSKNYLEDVIRPIKRIGQLTAEGSRFEKVKQTTQFVVGASDETDRELVQYSWGLYQRLGMHRIYFSAYQRGAGAADLPGEHGTQNNADLLTREHRLYQVDWLIRKYGFSETQIPFESGGNLSLISDPKEIWARHHPEFFPLDINRAGKFDLLKVPGLGPRTVGLILRARYEGRQIRHIEDLGPRGKRLQKAEGYLKFGERVSLFE